MQRVSQSIKECIARAEFVSVAPDDVVADAVAAMLNKNTDCVLVVEDEKLVGIFTERDFVQRVTAEKLDVASTKMREVMTEKPQTLRSHDRVSYAINQMVVGGYRNVPIVDEHGRPTSVLDVRLVMTHLIKVFSELEQNPDSDDDEWIDIGGG